MTIFAQTAQVSDHWTALGAIGDFGAFVVALGAIWFAISAHRKAKEANKIAEGARQEAATANALSAAANKLTEQANQHSAEMVGLAKQSNQTANDAVKTAQEALQAELDARKVKLCLSVIDNRQGDKVSVTLHVVNDSSFDVLVTAVGIQLNQGYLCAGDLSDGVVTKLKSEGPLVMEHWPAMLKAGHFFAFTFRVPVPGSPNWESSVPINLPIWTAVVGIYVIVNSKQYFVTTDAGPDGEWFRRMKRNWGTGLPPMTR